jgi:hypothetical protein
MLHAPAARPIGRYSRRSQHMQAWQAGITLLQRGIIQLDHKREFQEWWLGDWVRLRLLCCSSSLLSLAYKLTGASARLEQRCFEHTATAGIMQRCFATRLHFNFEKDFDDSDDCSSSFGKSDGSVADDDDYEHDDDEHEDVPVTPEPGFRVKSGAIAVQARSFSAL